MSSATRVLAELPLELGTVDLVREQLVLHAGGVQRLTTREAALLRYLAARQGETVTREELQTEVWGYAPDLVTRAVDNTVRRLRRKMERDPAVPDHLLTVHGEGYRLVVPQAAEASTDTASPAQQARAPVAEPALAGSFHGRDEDLAAIEESLDAGRRLVSLVGPGGVGKTRLARELLRRRQGRFVDLSETGGEPEVGAAIARALDLPGSPEALLVAVSRAEAQLLVLDNCEQNLVGVAGWVRRLLDAAPRLRLVATSRRPLGLGRERTFVLDPLDLHDGAELVAARAREAGLPVPEREPLEDLVERLDGLPLALELAAARLGVLGPTDLLERLGTGSEVLGRHGDPGRHGTLEAAVAWSWSLLEPWGQLALARCTVFPGPFDASAAEAVLPPLGEGAPPVLEALDDLRAHSLLQAEHGSDGRLRLRLLEAVRLFAAARLDEEDPALAAHARWAAALPPARHRSEHSQLHRAWTWARVHEPELAVDLQEGLAAGFRAHGPPEAWLAVADVTAVLPGLSKVGRLRARLGRLEARHALGRELDPGVLDDLVEEAGALGSSELAARALLARARSRRRRGALPEAEADYRAALARSDGAAAVGAVRHELATMDADRHDTDAAIAGYEAALGHFREAGSAARIQRTELHISMALSEAGRLDAARARSLEVLEGARASGDARLVGIVQGHLGLVELEAGDLSRAEEHVEAALRSSRSVGDSRYEGFARYLRAGIAEARGSSRVQADEARRAVAAFEAVGDRRFWALARARLAVAQARLDALDAAAESFGLARHTLERAEVTGLVQGVHLLEGVLDLARGDALAARVRLEEVGVLRATSFARLARRTLLAALG